MCSEETAKLPPTSKLLKDGKIARSVRAQNRAVSSWLPKQHSKYCQAVSDYLRYLLGVMDSQSPYPSSPTQAELHKLPVLSANSIRTNNTVFTSHACNSSNTATEYDDSSRRGRQKPCWGTFKHLFLADLAQMGVPRATFQWIISGDSQWNDVMLAFFVKHWNWAKEHTAFSRYAIDPEHSGDSILYGVVERWIRGRTQDVEKMAQNPNFQQTRRKSDRKKSLYNYRRYTMKQHLGEESLVYLPNVDCCSDTEDDANGNILVVNSLWRDEVYVKLLHTVDKLSFQYAAELQGKRSAAQRLDSRRLPSTIIDEHAAVAPNLPKECYRPDFYFNLRKTKRHLVTLQHDCESIESLLLRARELSNKSIVPACM